MQKQGHPDKARPRPLGFRLLPCPPQAISAILIAQALIRLIERLVGQTARLLTMGCRESEVRRPLEGERLAVVIAGKQGVWLWVRED